MREEDDDLDTPAPTQESISANEGQRELQVGWRVEYLSCGGALKLLPYTFYSYKSWPWGYRDGLGIRWLGFIIRFHRRFHTW